MSSSDRFYRSIPAPLPCGGQRISFGHSGCHIPVRTGKSSRLEEDWAAYGSRRGHAGKQLSLRDL